MEAGGRVSPSAATKKICGPAATRRKLWWLIVQSLPEQVSESFAPLGYRGLRELFLFLSGEALATEELAPSQYRKKLAKSRACDVAVPRFSTAAVEDTNREASSYPAQMPMTMVGLVGFVLGALTWTRMRIRCRRSSSS
jgi:hypothetical protein